MLFTWNDKVGSNLNFCGINWGHDFMIRKKLSPKIPPAENHR